VRRLLWAFRRTEKRFSMDKEKQRVWLIILFLVTIMLLFRYFPKAGYGLAAITLLVMLFRLRKT
jgi:hypothetical protein